MGKYKCPWCGSMNTGRHTYSYVSQALKGSIAIGGNIALAFFGPKGGFGGQAANATGNGLQEWMSSGCYDCVCKSCGKDFYVYYEDYSTKEIRRKSKENY